MSTPSSILRFAAVLALFTGACSKKVDLKSSTSDLEKAFPSSVAAPATTPGSASASAAPRADVQELVKTALAAAKGDEYGKGVIALQAAENRPGLTPEQSMAIYQSKQAMTTDLIGRAARGDKKALDQLKAIEKTRSQ